MRDVALPSTLLSLFAGIGGIELGLRLAVPGLRTVGLVERDAYAAAVLVARMEDETLEPTPIWDNVVTFDGRPWRGVVDCIAGGFPCQDISVAGKGGGVRGGARSGLWREYARIVREVEPRFVFVENVPALAGRGLDVVLGDLAALGFDADWDLFRASDVGAPHRRERLFILAHSERGPIRPQPRRRHGSRRTGTSLAGLAGSHGALADGDGRRCEGVRRPQPDGLISAHGRVPDGRGALRELDYPPGPGDAERWRKWAGPQPAVRRDADGLSARLERLRCLGNGVVPDVAALAWRVLFDRMGGVK